MTIIENTESNPMAEAHAEADRINVSLKRSGEHVGLDPGIAKWVGILSSHGVETFQSCEGGLGHSYPVPTIEFYGNEAAGWAALSVALDNGLPVKELKRFWSIDAGVPIGPHWAMTFKSPDLAALHSLEIDNGPISTKDGEAAPRKPKPNATPSASRSGGWRRR